MGFFDFWKSATGGWNTPELNQQAERRHYARAKARQKVHRVYAKGLEESAGKIGGPISDVVVKGVTKAITAGDAAAVTRA